MSRFEFDRVINRAETTSAKWGRDGLMTYFGKEDLLPFWVADMDFEVAPPIKDAVMKVAEHGIYGYSSRPDAYYQAAIDWMQRRNGYEIKKDWIVYSPGVVPAICNLLQAFCNEGDSVLIQEPVYYPFRNSIESNGLNVVVNELCFNGKFYEMDFEDFENKVRDFNVKVFILCNPHNPVSRLWTRNELEKIGRICIENGVIIISDEIHSDLVYSGYKHTVFASISEEFEKNCVVCTAPSKTFNLAGMQASNIIIANDELRGKYKKVLLKNNIELQNPFSIAATIAAYNEGEDWLDELLKYLEGNIEFINSFLAENLPEAYMISPQATYLGWIDFRAYEKDGEKLQALIYDDAKVAMDGGTWFGSGGNGFMRINFACPTSILAQGLNRIADTINQKYRQK